ncbi:MAG: macro domain-containing protein [Pyramidobacter sp.]|nr:macro domain-containing protein [Pyramidobacter sp.]
MPLHMLSDQSKAFESDVRVVSVAREECSLLSPGESELASASFGDASKYVIRTLPPTWRGGMAEEENELRGCYRSLLALVYESGFKSVEIPVLGLAQNGFPKVLALRIAGEEIYAFLEEEAHSHINVWLILPGQKTTRPLQQASSSVSMLNLSNESYEEALQPDRDVDDFIRRIRSEKENFHDMLFRLIWDGETSASRRKTREVAVYRSIFMSRQQFYKLRAPDYTPSKETILWLAIALKLTPEETHELLNTAGYTFCRWKDFDLIVLYFISKGIYDIMLINEMLCSYGQKTFLLC